MQQHHCPAALSFHSESYTPGNVERNECCSGISQPRLLAKSKRWFSTKRFVTCDGSSVPATVDVLGRLGNRSVAFVGDSVTSQLFNAMIADLVAHGQTVDYVHRWAFRDIRPSDLRNDGMCTIKNSGRHGGSELHLRLDPRDASPCKVIGYQGGSDPHKWGMRPVCLSIPEQQVELHHYAVRFSFYRMDMRTRDGKLGKYKMSKQWTDALGHCASAWHNFDGRLEGALRDHDAVVANFGMWYARECPARNRCGLDKYRDDLRHVLSRLQTLAPQGKLGLFRESNPQHFATPLMAPAYSRSLTRGVSRALAAKHSGRHLSTPRTGVTRLSRKWHKSWGFRATTLYGTRLCCVRCMLCTSRVRTNAEQTVRTTVTTHSSGQPSSTASIDTCTTGQAPRVGLNDLAWGLENY